MQVSSIHVYPIKSTAPIDLTESLVEPRGLANDRRYLIVDDKDRFLTARRYPMMLRIDSTLGDGAIEVSAPGSSPLRIPLDAGEAVTREVVVWRNQVPAMDMGDEAAGWFSAVLGTQCRLMHMGARCVRSVNPEFGRPEDEVSFADGYPLLVTSTASLADLNARLDVPVTMRRFRPNLVVDGLEAYAEDSWRKIRIGDVHFDVPKPCDRCVLTTIDPDKAEKDVDGEPLKTLGTYRDDAEHGILFGVHLIPRKLGIVRTGDAVVVEV